MKPKKVPLRKCVVSREQLPKGELLRVVSNKELGVKVDLSGKMNGRGAYVKKDAQVIKKAKKGNVLCKHLGVQVPDEVYEELLDIVNHE
ncbi:MAG: RNase P modulator RnpM [Candidatus Izemoplasmataceae bacterium]